MLFEPPEKISKADELLKPDAIGENLQVPVPGKFASLMQKETANPLVASNKMAMISPFDLPQSNHIAHTTASIPTLLGQVGQAQGTFGDLNTYLTQPGLKLKASQKYLINNKLSDANMHLQAVNAKLGSETPEPVKISQFGGPLGKFLAYLADGQGQLESAKKQLENLKAKGDQLTPGDFLLIQIKMNKAQQELDFSSVLLSNAVQDFKTLMQVQL